MALPNDNQDTTRDGRPAAATIRFGHRMREIRQELHQRHHSASRYQVAHFRPTRWGSKPLAMSVTSDEYQNHLYLKSRSTDQRTRLAAAHEAVTTSPYTWEDLTVDGVRERVEESLDKDALLAAAIESIGDLDVEDRPYFGKFLAERLDEILTDAEADFWRRFWRPAGA